ncbi:MAG: hypothetical protein J6B34_02175 [Clostridia bacterium]|nr:hypothetical protein [Clostridia bacterium]
MKGNALKLLGAFLLIAVFFSVFSPLLTCGHCCLEHSEASCDICNGYRVSREHSNLSLASTFFVILCVACLLLFTLRLTFNTHSISPITLRVKLSI